MSILAVICATLLAILLFGLSFYFSLLRVRTGILSYFAAPRGQAPKLAHIQRAQGNTTEYVPMLALLILFAGAQDPAPAWWGVFMVLATLARYMVVVGFWRTPDLERPSRWRALGAVLTYVSGLALAVGLLLYYLLLAI